MTSPSFTPTDRAQISERSHSDPPFLWIGVLLGSVAIHVVALGMLRLTFGTGFPNWRVDRTLIAVDVVTVAPEATPPTPSTLTPRSTTTRIPTTPNTPTTRTSSQSFNRPISSTSTSPSSPASPPPSNPQTSKPEPFQKETPATNPSQNQPSGTATPPTNSGSGSGTNNGTQPGGSGSAPSSNQNPTPPVEPSGGQNSSNTQSGGGFITIPNQPILVSNENEVLHTDRGDKQATLLQDSAQLSSEDLKALGINLEQVVELKVAVLIDKMGKASVYADTTPQVLQGNISADKAKQLAGVSVERLKFNPTVMAGQPVDRDYFLTLTINPKAL